MIDNGVCGGRLTIYELLYANRLVSRRLRAQALNNKEQYRPTATLTVSGSKRLSKVHIYALKVPNPKAAEAETYVVPAPWTLNPKPPKSTRGLVATSREVAYERPTRSPKTRHTRKNCCKKAASHQGAQSEGQERPGTPSPLRRGAS